MKRKIIKQGHNTLTVTLPTKWARKCNLNPGDEIEIEEQEGALLLNTSTIQATASATTLDLRNASIQVIWRSLISAYRAGYEEITILFENPKGKQKSVFTGFGFDNLQLLISEGNVDLSPIEAIQALVNRLIGMEIIDQKESRCIVKEMGEITYKEFDNALRRIFFLLLSMADEIYTSYSTNHKEPLRSIHLIDTNIDRFEDFCLRVLNKIGYKSYRKTTVIYTAIFLLEMIGDEYRKIALHLLDFKDKQRELMKKELEIQHAQLRKLYDLFYDFSTEKIQEVYSEDEKGDRFLRENAHTFTDNEMEIIHHLKKIGIFVVSLTELRLDLEA
ncbi:MAG: AbrB/MazE/SpoVT family DNA-binding domain-containing protein [Nanoarchaeota archaeon]